jgi:hypothetical protein
MGIFTATQNAYVNAFCHVQILPKQLIHTFLNQIKGLNPFKHAALPADSRLYVPAQPGGRMEMAMKVSHAEVIHKRQGCPKEWKAP